MTIQIPELFTSWTFWFLVAGAVVVIAASLLITILLVARSIRSEARRALEAVRRIDDHTAPIWRLQGVLQGIGRVRTAAERIADRTEALAGAVHGTPGGTGRTPGGEP